MGVPLDLRSRSHELIIPKPIDYKNTTLYGKILSLGFQLCPISQVMRLSKTERNQLLIDTHDELYMQYVFVAGMLFLLSLYSDLSC